MTSILKKNKNLNFVIACVVTALLSTLFVYIGVDVLNDYGWTVFALIPFFSGVTTTILISYYEPITFADAFKSSLLVFFACCGCLLLFAIEGIICIFMAAPIAIPFVILGAFVGYKIQHKKSDGVKLMILYILVAPSLLAVENNTDFEPTIFPIKSSITIDAPIEEVWKQVIEFPQMDEPTEFLFKTGIAYPINANIEGKGVGAIRYCNFSTGSFVEPITAWNEPNLLAFSVEKQPIPMKEISMYDINPAHLHEYFVSKKGQFKLTKLKNGKTLVEGTTWYYNKIQPEFYWKIWSTYIVHKIHDRVLNHIKVVCEK
jgi:hypothetical protein